MDVIEEVVRKKTQVRTKNWRKAHSQIKDLLEKKFDFSEVYEETYKHHEEQNTMYSEIYCISTVDKYSKIKLEIDIDALIVDDTGDFTISTISTIITTYPEDTAFRKSLFYFAMRAFWDKTYYGWARAKFKKQAIEISNQVNERLIAFLGSVR